MKRENARLTVSSESGRYPGRVSKISSKTAPKASPKGGYLDRVRRSPRAQRQLFIGALALFAAGALALTFVFLSNTASNRETAISNEPADVLKAQKKVPVSDAAKQVAETWILGAVTRKDLVGTYDLTHPDIRGSMTRAEWETGNIPVVPYPLEKLYDKRWRITYSYEDEALLEVGLIPAEGQEVRALTFFIGLKKEGSGADAHWVVNYWSPRYKPPVPTQ